MSSGTIEILDLEIYDHLRKYWPHQYPSFLLDIDRKEDDKFYAYRPLDPMTYGIGPTEVEALQDLLNEEKLKPKDPDEYPF